jgi:hypothetical protein
LLGLVRQRAEDRLGRRHAPQVDCDQRGREGTVDQREVDDYVYIVEAILQDREANGYRDSEVASALLTPHTGHHVDKLEAGPTGPALS